MIGKKIIFLMMREIFDLGGREEQVVRLALKLKEAEDFLPVVFSYLPVSKNNPYIKRLGKAGIRTSLPPRIIEISLSPLYFIICILSIPLFPVYVIYKRKKATPSEILSNIRIRLKNEFIAPIERFLYKRNLESRLTKESKINPASLLHFHSLYEGIEKTMRWGKFHKIPIIYTEHNDISYISVVWPYMYSSKRIKAIKETATIFHLLSPTLEKKFKQVAGEDIKTVVIPNWVEDSSRQFPRIKSALFTIGAAGRIVEMKGFHILIESLKILKQDYNVEFYCEIAGEGEYSKKIRMMINSFNLQRNVKLPGKINTDIGKFLSHLDVFVLPSYSETLSLIVLHSMNIGIPVITTGVGGITDFITDGINGIVVEPKNPSALAKAIFRVYENPEMAKTMGAEGRNTFLQKYSEKAVFPKFVDLYDTLIEKNIEETHRQ